MSMNQDVLDKIVVLKIAEFIIRLRKNGKCLSNISDTSLVYELTDFCPSVGFDYANKTVNEVLVIENGK
jgi:hypothetical protein